MAAASPKDRSFKEIKEHPKLKNSNSNSRKKNRAAAQEDEGASEQEENVFEESKVPMTRLQKIEKLIEGGGAAE